ncbi:lysophospholipid acyltransferase family protein [Tritonibacter horizontis]|uniref:2-acyl-glycerophospho-ethanolamine acyltransferase n=1 Tax=Tritonibacter horizontis TaxID=1768241 RepID=A0A132BX72_9RHOB|nr:lysophospholipid acyltransferase family protein [Tritonibacter horizontis]KUP92652.1 2-acyl-glycerophospho-ethanolamine acyltransferase [Tritonibacter horizontis]
MNNISWNSDTPPESVTISGWGWLRVGLRGLLLAILVFGGLLLLLLARLVERPLCGARRPATPWLTLFVCRNAFRVMGIRFTSTGRPMTGPGIIVANHSSWLDIFALNARSRIYFVSKSEVAGWPGIGWLARATGTVFIERDRKKASAQKALFGARLKAGHRLLFFPEGTSTDGLRVLPFKTTLFASLFEPDLRDQLSVQPVSVAFHAPNGAEPRFYGWWGDMDFGSHFLRVLAASPQGRVDVTYHPPVAVSRFENRKALAAYCEETVRMGHTRQRQGAVATD